MKLGCAGYMRLVCCGWIDGLLRSCNAAMSVQLGRMARGAPCKDGLRRGWHRCCDVEQQAARSTQSAADLRASRPGAQPPTPHGRKRPRLWQARQPAAAAWPGRVHACALFCSYFPALLYSTSSTPAPSPTSALAAVPPPAAVGLAGRPAATASSCSSSRMRW